MIFNLWYSSVGNTMTAEGGTAQEALGKTVVDPSPSTSPQPAVTPKLKPTATGQSARGKATIPKALEEALAAGKIPTAAAVHVNAENLGVTGKPLKFGILEPAGQVLTSEPELVKVVQTWKSVAFTEAHAKELTSVAAINALTLFVESLTAKNLGIYELYLSIECEEAPAETAAEESMLV